jgi:hypothetical protein
LVCLNDGVYVPSQGPEVVSPRKMGKENSFDGKADADLNSQMSATGCSEKKSKKTKRGGLKEMCNGSRDEGADPNRSSLIKPIGSEEISKKEVQINGKDSSVLSKKDAKTQQDAGMSNALKNENARAKPKKVRMPWCTMNIENTEFDADIPMPQGASLASIADVELHPEDVGHALQFLEFCASFGKVNLTLVLLRPKLKSVNLLIDCRIFVCLLIIYQLIVQSLFNMDN